MKLTCPHCNFSKEIDAAAAPQRPVQVTCPKCATVFTFNPQQDVKPAETGQNNPPAKQPGTMTQAMVDAETKQEEIPQDQPPTGAKAPGAPPQPPPHVEAEISARPAGFWVRWVAFIIDSIISSVLQFVVVFALGTITELSGAADLPATQILIMLFSTIAGVFYYVFFTGYSGQTPGKMVLRLKVVRLDNSQVGYGQAFIRETIGKFISGIVLGIGYLMVGLREDKRGLHDLMADTRVIHM